MVCYCTFVRERLYELGDRESECEIERERKRERERKIKFGLMREIESF